MEESGAAPDRMRRRLPPKPSLIYGAHLKFVVEIKRLYEEIKVFFFPSLITLLKISLSKIGAASLCLYPFLMLYNLLHIQMRIFML